MKSQFVTYEIAKDLKELGFNEPCFATFMKHACSSKNPFEYDIDFHTKVEMSNGIIPINSEYVNDWISAPLWQQVIEWFIVKYEINIILFSDGFQWTFDLRSKDSESMSNYPMIMFPRGEVGRTMYPTYKEARVNAVLKAIEIIKNKNK